MFARAGVLRCPRCLSVETSEDAERFSGGHGRSVPGVSAGGSLDLPVSLTDRRGRSQCVGPGESAQVWILQEYEEEVNKKKKEGGGA